MDSWLDPALACLPLPQVTNPPDNNNSNNNNNNAFPAHDELDMCRTSLVFQNQSS